MNEELTFRLLTEQTEYIEMLAVIYEKDKGIFDYIKNTIRFNYGIVEEW